jgi:hypothetical protein
MSASLQLKSTPSVLSLLAMIMPWLLAGLSTQFWSAATPAPFSANVYSPVAGAANVPSTAVPLSALPAAPLIAQANPF